MRPRAWQAAVWAAVVLWLPASPVRATETRTCSELQAIAEVQEATKLVAERTGPVVDLTSAGLFGAQGGKPLAATFDAYEAENKELIIVGLDLPRDTALVDVTCALGRELDLNIDQTMVVVTSVGMHAYSGGIGYHQIRVLSRRHNAQARHHPLEAGHRLADSLLDATREAEATRDRLGITGALLLLAGVAVLLVQVRRS